MGGFFKKILNTIKHNPIESILNPTSILTNSFKDKIQGVLGGAVIKDPNGNVITNGKIELSNDQAFEMQKLGMDQTFRILEENNEHYEKMCELELKKYKAESDRNVAFEGTFKDIPDEAKLKRSMLRVDIAKEVWTLGKWMAFAEIILQIIKMVAMCFFINEMPDSVIKLLTNQETILPAFVWEKYVWIFSGTTMTFFLSRTGEKFISQYKKGNSVDV